MADTSKPAANPTKPDTASAPSPAPVSGILVLIARDYWPKGERPAGLADDEEYRVRSGATVMLSPEEAMDVVEAGIGTRARREDALKV